MDPVLDVLPYLPCSYNPEVFNYNLISNVAIQIPPAADTVADDEDSDSCYEPQHSDILNGTGKKYFVDKLLGSGAYGTVVKCRDIGTGGRVAVKIARRECTQAAVTEAVLLKAIRDREGANDHLVGMVDVFLHKKHLCIALELMDMSLADYIYKFTAGRSLDLVEIRRVLRDILTGLQELKEMGIVHADLKPDNVMLRNCGHVRFLRAKIIDFGLAHSVGDQSSNPHIQTLYYRSPEVITHCLPYSEAIDVWSVGCIMGEMLTKRTMYKGRCEYDQMRYIVEIRGLPPLKMMVQGCRSSLFFTETTDATQMRLKTPEEFMATVADDGYQKVTAATVFYSRRQTFDNMTIAHESMPLMDLESDYMKAELSDRLEAFKLFEELLKLDPEQRISAKDALRHSFFELQHMLPFVNGRNCEWVRDNFECMNIPVP